VLRAAIGLLRWTSNHGAYFRHLEVSARTRNGVG
jgi:hypothetical protein